MPWTRAPKRSGYPAAPRIVDPATHPQQWVLKTVAADFLDMDVRALNAYLEEGKIAWEWKGRRQKIHIDEVVRFRAWQRGRSAEGARS